MTSSNYSGDIVVSALGVTSAIGQGKSAFIDALLQGKQRFDVMQRQGRQTPVDEQGQTTSAFIGAEIADLELPQSVSRREMRTASLTAQVALASVDEAWQEAKLDDVDPSRIGVVVGGSNLQQRHLVNQQNQYAQKISFLRPTYAMSFLDSDICGLITQTFGITGFAFTIGGASASGQVAVIEAIEAVKSGRVDVCIAVGALMDLSYWECQGFRSLGAMGSDRYADSPQLACRPFDKDRNGFIFGESCGVVVVEKAASAKRTNADPYARIAGYAIKMDAHRNPDPSFDGEVAVIEQALTMAKIDAGQIDYINPHGTGSTIGDETELAAIKHCGLTSAAINATKSITGHGLTAAGATELIATMLQMKAKQLHPCLNLDNPMCDKHNWVQKHAISHDINYALKMSMGFGGMNSAICLHQL